MQFASGKPRVVSITASRQQQVKLFLLIFICGAFLYIPPHSVVIILIPFSFILFSILCWCSKKEEYAISYISYMYDIVCLYTSFFRMKRTTAELARSRRRTPRRPGKRRRTSTGSRRSNCPLGMP